MKSTLLRRTAVAVLAFAFPIAALANVSGTVTLPANNGLSLDTGATSSSNSSGDIYWNGSSITFIGKAKGAVLTGITGSSFSLLSQSLVQDFSTLFSTAAISSGSLPAQTIFALVTNGGNYAAAMVTSVSAGSITLQYVTYVTVAPTGPQITKVTNNYSYTPNGFANSGISPSTIFTIFGANLAAASTGAAAGLQDSTKGIPTTWNGATVTVTVGGKTFTPGLYYALPTQIAGVLPAGTPTGTGTLTVSYNGTASTSITVVPNALGFDTYYGTGSGLITATSATTGALFNYTNSASPGQTIVLWASGLGADAADSDTVFTNTPHSVNQSGTQIYFGGVAGTVGYAGSSGYPGLNQINVTIPLSAGTGCYQSVAGVVNGVTSNFGTLPIAQGGGVCSDPIYGINGNQISTQSGQINVSSGAVFVLQGTSPGTTAGTTQTFSEVLASFQRVTGSYYGASSGQVSIPGCIVTQSFNSGTVTTTETGLNAGTITVTGPSGGPVTVAPEPSLAGFYFAQLAAGAIPASGGTFTFNGSGGSDVGPFTVNVNFPNPLLAWTNQSAAATVTRAQGLTFNWNGGAPGSYVIMSGSSSAANASGFYTCLAPVSAQTFTVPSYVLGALPAGTGNTAVENSTSYTTFSATGISSGAGFGAVSFSVNTNYN